MKTIYQKNGFKNRKEYLENIAEEFGVDYFQVEAVAELLGEGEDFDGLLNMIEMLQ